jgi:hypothetical protein
VARRGGIARHLKNEEAMARVGPAGDRKKKKKKLLRQYFSVGQGKTWPNYPIFFLGQ